MAGCLVYVATILVVLYLLVAGGSFKRMKEQVTNHVVSLGLGTHPSPRTRRDHAYSCFITPTAQADAYQQQGAKAFQVPLTAKPRLYDALLEASRTLPRKPRVEGGRLQGKAVELLVLDTASEHEDVTQALFDISDGSPRYGQGSYDPVERIWRWLPDELGPFADAAGMGTALRKMAAGEDDGLSFYVVSLWWRHAGPRCSHISSTYLPRHMPQRDRPSGYVIGMARLVNNAPQHLRAEIGDVWLTPAFRGTYAGVECGQLLLRYLFGTLGYVRTYACGTGRGMGIET